MTDDLNKINNDGVEADISEPAAPVASENKVGVDEYIGIAVKSIAVVLSIVVLLLSVLSVTLPLSAMRTFNSLGLYERALASGTRYIDRELRSVNAEKEYLGKYAIILSDGMAANAGVATKMSTIPVELNNDGFTEALDVCINLSDKLMRSSAAAGDGESARYFAEYLEKYTRYFLSVEGVSTTFSEKDLTAYKTFPVSYLPYVYSYKHSLMTLNFRARYYMGALDNMLYDGGRNGDFTQTLSERSNTFSQGSTVTDENGRTIVAQMNRFIDYADQISEYLALELARAGVEERLGEAQDIQNKYRGRLNGSEFALFLTIENGYTQLYENLKSVHKYAQAAVAFTPANKDEQLMQLYWLQKLNTLAARCWNMEMLIWINRESYGLQMSNINDKYGAYEYRRFDAVQYPATEVDPDMDRRTSSIGVVYDALLKNYIGQ